MLLCHRNLEMRLLGSSGSRSFVHTPNRQPLKSANAYLLTSLELVPLVRSNSHFRTPNEEGRDVIRLRAVSTLRLFGQTLPCIGTYCFLIGQYKSRD